MKKRASVRAAMAALSGVVVATGVFFAGMYVARATPGGETRRALSFSGTLTGRSGPQTLVFTFHKGSSTICAPTVMTTPDPATGAVNVEIPLDACPTTLFDGSDVTFDVSVGGTALSPSQPINPVPYATYADRVGTPDCPTGYERFTETGMPARAIYCRKGNDEMVRVGSAESAFWIDRYLSSIWSGPDGTGTRFEGNTSPVPANGNWSTPAYALSRRAVSSSGFVTWQQANALCRLVGKQLPSADEFMFAGAGTPCFGLGTRADECPGARGLAYDTGSTPQCISNWGAEQICSYRTQWSRSTGYLDGGSGGQPGSVAFIIGPLYTNILAIQAFTTGYASGTTPTIGTENGFRCMKPR